MVRFAGDGIKLDTGLFRNLLDGPERTARLEECVRVLRTFLAIELPVDVRWAIVREAQRLSRVLAVYSNVLSWAWSDNLHVTVKSDSLYCQSGRREKQCPRSKRKLLIWRLAT